MPRGKKKVVAEAPTGPLAAVGAKYARLRKRVDEASGAAKTLPQMLKCLLTDDVYRWGTDWGRPITVSEMGVAIERVGAGIHNIEDAIEDIRRRLSSLEAKVFPNGSPGAGKSTEAAFADSLANSIANKPVPPVPPVADDEEGKDII